MFQDRDGVLANFAGDQRVKAGGDCSKSLTLADTLDNGVHANSSGILAAGRAWFSAPTIQQALLGGR